METLPKAEVISNKRRLTDVEDAIAKGGNVNASKETWESPGGGGVWYVIERCRIFESLETTLIHMASLS